MMNKEKAYKWIKYSLAAIIQVLVLELLYLSYLIQKLDDSYTMTTNPINGITTTMGNPGVLWLDQFIRDRKSVV